MKPLRLLALLLCTGCVLKFGPKPEDFEPANTASGIEATIALATRAVKGELLEVRETALVILTSDLVALVPFNAITSGAFMNTKVSITNGQAPTPLDRNQLRLLSRYPQGAPSVAMMRILVSKKQDTLVVLR
jgi:hypothetical protein